MKTMLEIIDIIGTMSLVFCMTYRAMTEDELAFWFAESTGNTNPQNRIRHLRLKNGESTVVSMNKICIQTIENLILAGYGLPEYLYGSDKNAIILFYTDPMTGEEENCLITQGVWRHIWQKIRFLKSTHDCFDAQLEIVKVENAKEIDGQVQTGIIHLPWLICTGKKGKNKQKMDGLTFTITRDKEGGNTAAYRLDENVIVIEH
tara:strand:- start:571 stop:1182 length:612 start_codon:yes stop_codon:yes gene_type:complete